MQGLSFQQADMGVINKYAENAGKFSDASFYNFEGDTQTFFYLLPPWPQNRERALLARQIWETFLPNKSKWVSLRSWEYLNAEYASIDPIEAFINDIRSQAPIPQEVIKEHSAKPRFYANVLVWGTKKVLQQNAPFQAFPNALVPQILNMPASVWNELCVLMSKPGFEVAYHPEKMIMWMVTKTGRKLNTEYKVEFSGSQGPTGEVTVNRINVAEKIGVERFQAIINGLPDLDKRWPAPTINSPQFVQAREEAVRLLKTKFLSTGQNGFNGIPGASIGPMGSVIGGQSIAPSAPPPPVAPSMVGYPQVPSAPQAPQAPVISGPPGTTSAPLPQPTAQVFVSSQPQSPIPQGLMVPDVPVPQIPNFPPFNVG